MAHSAQGTLLQVSISTVFTTIGLRTRINPHDNTRAKLETTDLDSSAEESIAGIRRGGEIELEGNYNAANAQHAYLWASYDAGTVESWKLILADSGAATFAFSGWISSFKVAEAATDVVQKFNIKIQVTGVTVLTP